MSLRTANIGIRVQPEIKLAIERAAELDHRTVASLIEKVMIEYLRAEKFLPAGVPERTDAMRRSLKARSKRGNS